MKVLRRSRAQRICRRHTSAAVRRPSGCGIGRSTTRTRNPRLRTTLIQLAWLWVRHQPHSALTLWFRDRVKQNGGRLKKATIVALARKLLVALWKYLNGGVVIEGAIMKTA